MNFNPGDLGNAAFLAVNYHLKDDRTYATDNSKGDGVPGAVLVETLGYAAVSLDSPDMVGSDQNRIMMATSTDGVNWTPFNGPADGGAIIAPQNELTSSFNPQTWTIDRSYGSGYPSALIRDGNLELYFTDEDSTPGMDLRRVRIPVDQIQSPAAWAAARAPGNPSLTQVAPYGSDIKWSPQLNRYFAASIELLTPGLSPSDPNFKQVPTIVWSNENPDASLPPSFPAGNEIQLPTGGRVGIWGGLLADGSGHTLDLTSSNDPRTIIDSFYESFAPGGNPIFDTEIAHASVTFRATAAPAPQLSVDGITDGQTIDFGSASQGSPTVLRTFTVRNSGNATLVLGGVSVPNDFVIITPLAASLAPGQSATFTIGMLTANLGTHSGIISIASNDPNHNPFHIAVVGRVVIEGPSIAVDGITDGQSNQVDFGSPPQSDTAPTKTFTVHNQGSATLTLGNVSVPVGFTVVKAPMASLLPGASTTLTVRLETTTAGTYQGQISFATNDPQKNPFNFPVIGHVKTVALVKVDGVVSGQATAIDFGTIDQSAAAPTKIFTVRNAGSATLNLGAIKLPCGYSLVEGLSTSLAAGKSDTFTVRLNTTTPGTFTGDITFTTSDASLSVFHIPVTGKVNPIAVISITGVTDGQKTAVDFGSVNQGLTVSKVFTIHNTGTATLVLGKVTLPTGFTLVSAPAATVAPGKSTTFTVGLTASTPGTYAGLVTIATNDANHNLFKFPIIGKIAPVPQISVDGISDQQSTSIQFGTVAKGSASPTLTFTVRNTGTAALNLGSLQLAAGFKLVEGLSSTIEPGKSDTFKVSLDTSVNGTFSGQIRFGTNVAGHATFAFPVDGTVITVSSRYGTVTGWQMTSSTNSTILLKQVKVAGGTGNTDRLYADFLSASGATVQSDVPIGNFAIVGNEISPRIAVLSGGNYAIAWQNTSLTVNGGIHYAVYGQTGIVVQSNDRIANISLGGHLVLTSITSDSKTGGFTVFWFDSSTSKSWKRTFNLVGIATSGEIAS